jgi:hypothetical protein
VHLAHPLELGIPVTHSDIFGVHGQAWLDELKLPQPYAGKVASLRQLAGTLTGEIALLDKVTADLLAAVTNSGRAGHPRRTGSALVAVRNLDLATPVTGIPNSACACAPGPGRPRGSRST